MLFFRDFSCGFRVPLAAENRRLGRDQGQAPSVQYARTVAAEYGILFAMRKCRTVETGRCYHLISRLAHRAFFLDDDEKTRAVDLMRRVEEFSGILILAYAFMSNHFHIFIYVPEVEELGEDEILRRINTLYRGSSLAVVLGEWNRLKEEESHELACGIRTAGYVSRFSRYKAAFVKRMWNSVEFMKTYKQHFTMSFNGRREHFGTMFEGRYRDRNHQPEQSVMWKTSAYVDVNPVNAGLCRWPDGYEWCSFAAACKGDEKARRGYEFMYGMGGDWEAIRTAHEVSIRAALDEVAAADAADGKGAVVASASKSKSDPGLELPRVRTVSLEKGDAAVAERILELLSGGPMKPAALRAAVGIRRRDHFNEYYIAPMLEKGLIERADPAHPQSPQQMYRRVK